MQCNKFDTLCMIFNSYPDCYIVVLQYKNRRSICGGFKVNIIIEVNRYTLQS